MVLLSVAPTLANTLTSEDNHLRKLGQYFRQDQHKKFAVESVKISKNSVYHPLVVYWSAVLRLRNKKTDEMEQFVLQTKSAYFRHQAQQLLVRYAIDKKDWSLFKRHVTDAQVCATLYDSVILQQKKQINALRQQWQGDVRMNNATCVALYRASIRHKILTKNDVWVKIRQLAGTASLNSVRRFLAAFPGYIRYREVRKVVRQATRYISGRHGLSKRAQRELLMISAMVAVRKNPKTAIGRWKQFSVYFSDEENDHVWSVLGEWAARWHRDDALQLLEKTSGVYYSDNTRAWYLRAALQKKRCKTVLKIVESMPQDEQSITAWQYWRAFCLEHTGRNEQAMSALKLLAQDNDDYYGLLAREKLGKPLISLQSPLPASKLPIDKDFLLAMALHKINYQTLARKIWRYGVKRDDIEDSQRIAIAQAAQKNEWYLAMIEMANSVDNANAHALRYPTPYRSDVNEYAKKFSLDLAFVYGLMRQESRFMKDIVSSAGARGLMQVMPRTAQYVAKKNRYTRYNLSRLKYVQTNLIIGMAYLSMLVDQVSDQPAKIAAAYNAGPTRVKRWFGVSDDLLITIENIPITETRLYVKHVLANRAHYQSRLKLPSQSMRELIEKPISTTL